jgi:guanyl-specific ribonuclease Sa
VLGFLALIYWMRQPTPYTHTAPSANETAATSAPAPPSLPPSIKPPKEAPQPEPENAVEAVEAEAKTKSRVKAEPVPAPAALPGPQTQVLESVAVKSYDRVVYRGQVDLRPTIARILRGERHSHRNDGSVFRNRERRLPQRKRGFYKEYVHPTKGIRGPGPQRVIRGGERAWYYTADHYDSFRALHRRAR